ncbi:MAG: patatin-like phospholipase family protein [Spirosomataceae bacterium]
MPLSEKFKRPTIEQDFQSWMTNLKAVDTIQTAVPIIFIAAEGGGLRGTIWTGLFLDQMEKEMPGIHKNIYAISGVSGGGVGATFYISNLYDKLKSDSCGGCANQNFRKTIRADFLSDVLAASLFQDNIQKFIPIGINSFNRTRRLEEAWSKSFRENNNSLTFDKAFTQLWQDTASRLPRLFINGVLAETGQKTIVSYPCINRKETNDPFQDEIDVIAQTGSDMPVKTAASLCSRFPYITSGGLIQTQSKIPIGHVIDGGYKENTGLETIWQILLRLKPAMANVQKINEGLTIRPIIIFIKNSPSNEVLDKNKSIANLMHEINIPIIGFMNAAFRISTKETLTEKIFKDFHTEENKPLDPLFFTVALERSDKGLGLPLGWYFSEESFNYVDVDINRVFSDKKHKMHELRRYFPKK